MGTTARDLKTLLASAQPRPLITAEVDRLASSIREIGLIQPITVQHAVVMSGLAEAGFQIVAGHHRVAACRALGWTEIDAIVIETTERLQADLIEIDENLCRSELTAGQRSSFTKRRKTIWEALHPVVSQKFESVWDALPVKPNAQRIAGLEEGEQVAQLAPPVAKHGHAQARAFAAETASITGESKSQVNRHIARADALGNDLDRVAGTSLDKGVELDAMKSMTQPERTALIDRAVAGEQVSARGVAFPELSEIQLFASRIDQITDSLAAGFGCRTVALLAAKFKKMAAQAGPDDIVALDDALVKLIPLIEIRKAVGLRLSEFASV